MPEEEPSRFLLFDTRRSGNYVMPTWINITEARTVHIEAIVNSYLVKWKSGKEEFAAAVCSLEGAKSIRDQIIRMRNEYNKFRANSTPD